MDEKRLFENKITMGMWKLSCDITAHHECLVFHIYTDTLSLEFFF